MARRSDLTSSIFILRLRSELENFSSSISRVIPFLLKLSFSTGYNSLGSTPHRKQASIVLGLLISRYSSPSSKFATDMILSPMTALYDGIVS